MLSIVGCQDDTLKQITEYQTTYSIMNIVEAQKDRSENNNVMCGEGGVSKAYSTIRSLLS